MKDFDHLIDLTAPGNQLAKLSKEALSASTAGGLIEAREAWRLLYDTAKALKIGYTLSFIDASSPGERVRRVLTVKAMQKFRDNYDRPAVAITMLDNNGVVYTLDFVDGVGRTPPLYRDDAQGRADLIKVKEDSWRIERGKRPAARTSKSSGGAEAGTEIIKMATRSGFHEIPAVVVGEYAYHKDMKAKSKYSITHVPTGFGVRHKLSKSGALALIRRLHKELPHPFPGVGFGKQPTNREQIERFMKVLMQSEGIFSDEYREFLLEAGKVKLSPYAKIQQRMRADAGIQEPPKPKFKLGDIVVDGIGVAKIDYIYPEYDDYIGCYRYKAIYMGKDRLTGRKTLNGCSIRKATKAEIHKARAEDKSLSHKSLSPWGHRRRR
jgi:hypothetical protein